MSVNSKHLEDIANPGFERISLFHVRSGANEGITIEQAVDLPWGIRTNVIEVSLDALDGLIEALLHQRSYYRPPDRGPGPYQPRLG